MAWPPPLSSRPSVTARRTGLAEIDAEDRAARAGAGAARLERNRKGRPVEALLQPRREQPDHAGMPVRPQPSPPPRPSPRCRARPWPRPRASSSIATSIACRSPLRRSSSAAMRPASIGSSVRAAMRAEIGAADAAAGVDARPEQEAQMKRLGRPGEPRHVHQRGQPDVVAAAQRQQSLGDEGAVETLERHHVGDGAERDDVEPAEQIGLRPRLGPEAARRAARG